MSVKLITPEFRASYAFVWEPKQDDKGKDKWSMSMVFNKDTLGTAGLKKIQDAINSALAEKWGKDPSKWPRQLKICLRDADQEDRTNPNSDYYDEVYVNSYFINCSTNRQPKIVDENVDPIMNQSDFYSGCYARASVNFTAYDNVSKGVGCYINSIMKIRDGEPIGGASSPERDFAEFKKDTEDNTTEEDFA